VAEDTLQNELSAMLTPVGQEAVLRWWGDLSGVERERLAEQVRGLDLPLVGRLSAGLSGGAHPAASAGPLSPPEIDSLSEMDPARLEAAREAGAEAVREGQVACYMVAGGQASRLGIEGPKGDFPITPVTGKSLFHLHAEKILAASRRYGAEIPWLILTSEATDSATRAIFARNDRYGLPAGQVTFLRQGSLPAFDTSGRILMRSRSEISLAPDGHGGALKALWDSGILERLGDRGLRILSYFQVDNPLVPPVDPVFLGLHILEGAEVSSKVVEKTDPDERIGVFAIRDGRLGVVEYSEISDEDRMARDASGRLLYRGGSVAIHAWSIPFIERLRSEGRALPYHPARKAVPCVDDSGRQVDAISPNGIKFESFIFDAIPLARSGIVVEVRRDEEFQPVKSAEGRDTPDQAREALSRLHARWLEGWAPIPRDEGGRPVHPVEVSPLHALDQQELRSKGVEGLKVDGPIYLGPGAG
jgi:UDP-N-acetylglucosamine/UDP-N-acetylgalactosamine diphosphorylase